MRSSKMCLVGSRIRPFLSLPLSCPASPLGLGFHLLAHLPSSDPPHSFQADYLADDQLGFFLFHFGLGL